jgi:TolA-binding protein
MKTILRSGAIFLSIVAGLPLALSAPVAQDQVDACCPAIQEEQAKYLANHQYNELVSFLSSSKEQDRNAGLCLDYAKASARYLQLKYLEEKQAWDDYFANGNTYRQELIESAQKVLEQAANTDCLRPKCRLLLWQFHQDQQDAFAQSALDDLITDLKAYAQPEANLDLIKEAADKLLAYQEKSKAREIYKLYVAGLANQKMAPQQFKEVANGFYQQGNLELAQSIYDIYIGEVSKTLPPDKLIPELFEIANLFVYKPHGYGLAADKAQAGGFPSSKQSHSQDQTGGPYDMGYAEQIYGKIASMGQEGAFNQDTIYLRAFNLEKMQAYQDAQKFYLELTQKYPDTEHFDEAIYKIGLINAYALANISEARKYFEVLGNKTAISPQVISSLYQLGLLAQWEGDLPKADSFYQQLIKNALDQYVITVAQAKERLKEIQENKPISYNLKTFLDLALNKEPALAEMDKTQLNATSYILEKNQNTTISSSVIMPQSGCSQVTLQYLWSGDLGGATPGANESNFQGAYSDSGTKDINIVIISPAGAIDRTFTMVDVY